MGGRIVILYVLNLSSFGLFSTVARHIQFQNYTVVYKSINGRRGRHRILEDDIPL